MLDFGTSKLDFLGTYNLFKKVLTLPKGGKRVPATLNSLNARVTSYRNQSTDLL